MEDQATYGEPARLFGLPETPEQLAIDCAKLKTLAQTIQDKRHTMCVPAQPDDYDLLLTRIYHTAAAVLPTLLAERTSLLQQVEEAKGVAQSVDLAWRTVITHWSEEYSKARAEFVEAGGDVLHPSKSAESAAPFRDKWLATESIAAALSKAHRAINDIQNLAKEGKEQP